MKTHAGIVVRLVIAWVALLAAGCPGSPAIRPSPIDIGALRRLAEEGKQERAVAGYADAYANPELTERTDPTDAVAWQTRGEILVDLFRYGGHAVAAKADPKVRESLQSEVPALKDPTGVQLLSDAITAFTIALANGMERSQHYVCASELAGIFRLKLARPELRRAGKGMSGFDELVYRRLMLESIAEYELYALARHPEALPLSGERAASALDDLAVGYRALAEYPTARREAVAYWNDRAAKTDERARQVRNRPEDPRREKKVDSTMENVLKEANDEHNKAVRASTGHDSPALVIEAFENALRCDFVAGEAYSDPPTAAQRVVLDAIRIDLDQLQKAALEQ